MFASRLGDEPPTKELHGIKVWIKEEKGSVFVIVRQGGKKEQRLRLVETHAGEDGGEFRFDLEKDCK